MKLLLWTREDPASLRVARELVAGGRFEDAVEGSDLRVDRRADAALGRVEGSMLTADHADRRFQAPEGARFERVLFLSKHAAASGQTAFTVHPIGNLGPETKFGGAPRTLSPPDPARQTALLQALLAEAAPLGFGAAFEATHHGPLMDVPSAFVEVGSGPADWANERFCAALARAVERGYLDAPSPAPRTVALGLGGGHYHPRHADAARTEGTAFGHLIPAYALEFIDDATLRAAAESSNADRFITDSKINASAVLRASAFLETLGLERVPLGP